jgi:hypothetical protein
MPLNLPEDGLGEALVASDVDHRVGR